MKEISTLLLLIHEEESNFTLSLNERNGKQEPTSERKEKKEEE